MSWSHSLLVAETYDLHQPVGSSVGDVEFYVDTVASVRGRILEPACGTGRVLIPLLEAGHEVEGVDHSPDMLEMCRRYCRDRGLAPVLYAADVSEFIRPERYEAIVMPRGSIRNVDGSTAALRTLDCFRRSLTPGGLLFLDVRIPVPAKPGATQCFARDDTVWTIEDLVVEFDPVANRQVRYGRFTKWRDGELVAMELHRFYFQQWSLREFTALLGEAGFVDVSVSADFEHGKPPASGSRYWNFRAVNPG